MAKIKLHYANFPCESVSATGGAIFIKKHFFQLSGAMILADEFKQLEEVSESAIHNIAKTVGWDVVGSIMAGPLGAIARAVVGGNSHETTFILTFSNKRVMIGTVGTDVYQRLVADKALFDALYSRDVQKHKSRSAQKRQAA